MSGTNVVLALLTMALMALSPLFAQKKGVAPVRVYVYTAEAEFVDAESKGRTESVQDLRKALSKKHSIVLAENRDGADFVLEVVGRTWVQVATWAGTPIKVAALTVTLTKEEYTLEIVGQSDRNAIFRFWVAAAEGVAGQVDRWVKDNGARIPRK